MVGNFWEDKWEYENFTYLVGDPLAQASAVLTSSNSVVMAQLAQMTVTMNSMQAQLKTLASEKKIKQGQKESSTARFTGEISLTGSRPAQQRKQYIKRKRITKKGWVAVKRDVNNG